MRDVFKVSLGDVVVHCALDLMRVSLYGYLVGARMLVYTERHV